MECQLARYLSYFLKLYISVPEHLELALALNQAGVQVGQVTNLVKCNLVQKGLVTFQDSGQFT